MSTTTYRFRTTFEAGTTVDVHVVCLTQSA
jgi:hypothetical protein